MKLSLNPKSQADLPPPPPDVVLASQSLGRRTVLEKLGLRFRVIVARMDEETITDSTPAKMLAKRAAAKASEIVNNPRVYMLSETRPTLIIAADSMAIVGKKTYGKSKDRDQVRQILKALMGRTHLFTTAVKIVLWDNDKVKKTWEKTITTK